MIRKIINTDDGSPTIEIPSLNVTYHSRHGALRESLHVYIDAGLKYWCEKNPPAGTLKIFEMGFGTGLNAWLTLIESQKADRKIFYETIELFPLEENIYRQLNYDHLTFLQLHEALWEKEIDIHPFFTFKKIKADFFEYTPSHLSDIIFYDAFAPSAQPELWTEHIFKKLYQMLSANGILVTYCSKGDVQRAMKAAGFTLEKLAGPPGKREMIRAHHSNV